MYTPREHNTVRPSVWI